VHHTSVFEKYESPWKVSLFLWKNPLLLYGAMVNLRESAEIYNDLGLALVPVAGKKPLKPWGNSVNFGQLLSLLGSKRATGIAVVLGERSNGLIARDFDDIGAYEDWALNYPEFAKVLPTVKTPRGFHVYVWTSDENVKTQNFADGELRAEKSIIVLPPSVNVNGESYKWLRDFSNGASLRFSVVDVGFDRVWHKHPSKPSEPSKSLKPSNAFLGKEEEWLAGFSLVETGDDLAEHFQPSARRQNHKAMLNMRRGLLALRKRYDWSDSKLTDVSRETFSKWYELNHFLDLVQEREDYMGEWEELCKSIATPLGESLVKIVWKESEDILPDEAMKSLKRKSLIRLSVFFKEMQRRVGKGVFYASQNQISEAMGRDPVQFQGVISRRIRDLREAGYIDRVSLGKGLRANRYRYLKGGSEEEP